MHEIVVLPLDGVLDSSLALTFDCLSAANRLSLLDTGTKPFSVTFHQRGRREITTGAGARYPVKGRLGSGPKAALILPGLGLATAAEIDALFARQDTQRLVSWLRKNAERFPIVGSSCSAVFLLAEAGLLDHQMATTTWWLAPVFRSAYPNVELDEARMVTESGRFICAGAALAQMDLMLRLISRLAGPDLARRVARVLAIEERPSQARYMAVGALAGLGEDASRAEAWVTRNLARPFSIGEMAKELGMSPRTLDRRVRAAVGTGPSRFVQRLRTEQAAHLLETTDLPIEEIAARVGYRDTTSLRRLIQRERRANPSELRGSWR